MFDDQSREYKNQFVALDAIDVDEYKQFVGDKAIEELKWLAEPLKDKVWANVNSTFIGGGVAEMLRSVIPFARGLGINCRWFVIEGAHDFFSVTKKFHNLLQGIKELDITMEEIFHAYLETIQQNLEKTRVLAHMVVIHDPQPAAAIMSGNIFGHILWRCHIDTTEASRRIWRFLMPYINQYSGAIFTDESFIKDGLQVPTYQISPCIDPLQPKNRQRTHEEAIKTLAPLFEKNNIDSKRPMILAVSRYDIHKNQKSIIEAFKKVKAIPSVKKQKPIFVIVGNSASDDPEGMTMYKTICDEIAGDPDIYPLLNIENNDEYIGALMKVSKCFIHVSTKEGFGLVVTEAMWHGTPVIGSKVGGIRQQVIDGNTGFLVEPFDVEKITSYIQLLLENKETRENLGENAIERVRKNFLLPTLIKKYLVLMRYYLEIDAKNPEFRINEITYSEIRHAIFGKNSWTFTSEEIKDKIGKLLEELETTNINFKDR